MKSLTVFWMLAIVLFAIAFMTDAMSARWVKKRQGHFEKRAIEFPDFEEFANYNSMPFPDFDYGDDATEDDELEGDDLMVKRGSGSGFVGSGTTPEHEMRRKRQLSASDDYFDFYPPPPTVPMPELDSDEQISRDPKPNAGEITDLASLISDLSLGRTSTLDMAKLIVKRSGVFRNALVESLKRVLRAQNAENCISADSAIAAIKIQALGKANQIITNGIMNFIAFLPKIMVITVNPMHSNEEHQALMDTFRILEKTLVEIRHEVDPILYDNIEEDQNVMKMMQDVQLLVNEINSHAARLQAPENIIRAAVTEPEPQPAAPKSQHVPNQ